MVQTTSLIIAALCVFQLSDTIQAYRFILEDVICEYADKNYFAYCDTYLVADAENTINANFTTIKSFDKTIEAHFVLMTSTMGKWIVPTGIDYRMTLCEIMKEQMLIGPMLERLKFNKNECPIPTGNYGNEHLEVYTGGFPDTFIPSKYRSVFNLFEGSKVILTIHIYAEVI